jgi:hypothetical protein
MKTSMLEYFKIILLKVHFSRKIFLKEYRKAIICLPKPEALHLKHWIKHGCGDALLSK